MTELFPLRPLQVKALDELRRSLSSGRKRPIIQASTGFGKTILAAHIVAGALSKGNRVCFVVPALSLIDQSFEKFTENGIDAGDIGIIQADHPWRRPHAPIQIASVQTLARRGFPEVEFVVIDEVHFRFQAIDKWLDECPEKIFIGLSATPWSRGLGDRFDDLLVPATLAELIEQKWLSPFRVFAPAHPDLSGIKTVAGDYAEGQLSERMSDAKLVGDVVSTWLEKAKGLPTLVFAVDRAHAAVIHDRFQDAGIVSAYVDANTPREERLEMGKKFQAREIQVICSVGTMTTGIDLDVRCIVYARPTKSEILWVQCFGRGLRNAPGKSELIVLDHSDTALRLGLPTDILHDSLRCGSESDAEVADRTEKETPLPIECRECSCLIPVRADCCPNCGWKPVRVSRVIHAEGELVELGSKLPPKSKASKSMTMEQKAEFYGELRGYALEKGYKNGWVAQKYRAKLQVWPNDPSIQHAPIRTPSMATRSWIKSEQIRWAKSQAKHGAEAGAHA